MRNFSHAIIALLLLSNICPALGQSEQKISQWVGHGFHWVQVDPSSMRKTPFEVTIPAGHRQVTVAIDDAEGIRVRNLLSMADVTKLGGDPTSGAAQKLSIEWNGLDDRGRPLPAGVYRARGLSLPGLKVEFDYSFGNPGNPPWQGYPNSDWGGDHEFPNTVAALGGYGGKSWAAFLGGRVAEGGDGMFAIDNTGQKVWGIRRHWDGAICSAVERGDEGQPPIVWIGLQGKLLMRIRADSAKPVGFRRPAGMMPEIRFEQNVMSVAVGGTQVAIAMESEPTKAAKVVTILDKVTGKKLGEIPIPDPVAIVANGLAITSDDRLIVSASAGVYQIQLSKPFRADAAVTLLKFPALGKAGPVTLNPIDQTLLVMDVGDDQNIKVFDIRNPDAIAQTGTVGTAGGGQTSLAYDPSALRNVVSMSVGADGKVLVAERGQPRRISFWSKEGTFEKELVGNTSYGAWNCTGHNQDPTLAYAYGVMYRIDPSKPNAYRPERFVSSGPKEGSPFALSGSRRGDFYYAPGLSPAATFFRPDVFRSDASGQMREYILQAGTFPVLYMDKGNGDYRPVAAVGNRQHHSVFPAKNSEGKHDDKAAWLWSDLNGDELVTDDELQAIPNASETTGAKLNWFYSMSWVIGQDLTFYLGGYAIKPVGFSDSGAPLYDVKQAGKLPNQAPRVRAGDHLVWHRAGANHEEAGYFFAGVYAFEDLKTGRTVATYPMLWPGVHGSMQGPPPEPGQTVGEISWSGQIDAGKELGHVIASHGNMGQAFLFTEDGLFISSIFRDTRQALHGTGEKLEKGIDWTGTTMYAEAFSGWFGKQDDGVVRYLYGHTSALVSKVIGLDDVRRFDAGEVRLSSDVSPSHPAVAAPADKPLTELRPMRIPRIIGISRISIDGDLTDWNGIESHEIRSGENPVGTIKATHDGASLYIAWQVIDPLSPMKNAAQDWKTLFKQGDCVDLMLGPLTPEARPQAIQGDLRLLLAPDATVVLYQPVAVGALEEAHAKFESPVHQFTMDSVTKADKATVQFKPTEAGYAVEAKIPFETLGVRYSEGLHLRGDFGILSSNEGGQLTERRCYLFNPLTNVVSDLPTEAELSPAKWGVLVLE